MKYFNVLLITETKKVTYQLFFLVITIITLTSLMFTLIQEKPFLLEKIMGDERSIQTVLLDFNNVDIHSDEAKENKQYLNLVEQSDLLAKEEMALKFEKEDVLTTSAINLAQLRNQFYQLNQTTPKKYSNYLPTKNENQLNLAFYQSIRKQNRPIYTSNSNLVMATLVFLAVFSLIWFPLIALITSDTLLEEIRHLSLTGGYPIGFKQKILSKLLFLCLVFLLGILLIPIILLILSCFFDTGNWSYPVSVYLVSYTTIPMWCYVLLHLFSYLLIGLFVTLLSFFINYLVNDLYLTLFISLGLYVLPYFFSGSIKWLWFLPSHYLNPTTSLSGTYLNGSFLGGYICGVFILFFWSVILFILLGYLLTPEGLRKRRVA